MNARGTVDPVRSRVDRSDACLQALVLLRQYFPKKTNLAIYTQDDLDAVAARLNGRPRKTLAFETPADRFAVAVASTT